MSKEKSEMKAFEFSATSQEVRSLMIEKEPWFIAKDLCEILNLSDTNMALSKLDEDEKLTQKVFGSGQKRKMWLVNESGLYALILRSNKSEAKSFRKWITSEVLPSLRKHGRYVSAIKKDDFIDARDVVYQFEEFNNDKVRTIELDGVKWISVNDLFRAISSRTSSFQAAKKLNMKTTNAVKIWLHGNTQPAWFTNQLGAQLLVMGSKVFNKSNELKLEL
jgi:prophage antirepressor-like protein